MSGLGRFGHGGREERDVLMEQIGGAKACSIADCPAAGKLCWPKGFREDFQPKNPTSTGKHSDVAGERTGESKGTGDSSLGMARLRLPG